MVLTQPGAPQEQRALKAKCSADECGQVWVVAYLPMPLDKVGMLAQRAACPHCANEHPTVAL